MIGQKPQSVDDFVSAFPGKEENSGLYYFRHIEQDPRLVFSRFAARNVYVLDRFAFDLGSGRVLLQHRDSWARAQGDDGRTGWLFRAP